MNLSSNAAVPSNANADNGAVYTGASFYPDHGCAAKLSCAGTNGASLGLGVGLGLRHSTSARTYYRLICDHGGSNNVQLSRLVAGAATVITTFTQAWTDGDLWAYEVTGASSGATLRVFRNGALVNTSTDTSGTVPAAGFPSIGHSGASPNPNIVDDWRAYDLGAPWRPNKGAVSW